MKKIICFFKGHKIKKGTFLDKKADYYYHKCCTRCGALFGLPNMTDEFIRKNYPMPK